MHDAMDNQNSPDRAESHAAPGSPPCRCATCGYKWTMGTNGSHSCVGVLFAENARLREKLRETKRYLCAANRGAERNAIALRLSVARIWQLIDRQKVIEREANDQMETRDK